jgi:rhodanese-related sulfurtransferase
MKTLPGIAVFISLLLFGFSPEKYNGSGQDEYVCIPCGSDCDNTVHKGPGKCEHCNMDLVKKSTVRQNNVKPEDLCSFIAKNGKDNVVLLDVRTADEFNGKANDKFGRLNNAVNIPIQELDKRMKELAKYKDKQIVVYCSHSHRSPRASYMLSQNGFNHVTNMLGGMSVWKTSVTDAACNQQIFVSQ